MHTEENSAIEDFEGWITKEIKQFVKDDPDNRLKRLDDSAIFDEPLVGFVAGDDEIFKQLKQVIGEFHLTPEEALTKATDRNGHGHVNADELGVISYVLPISDQTRTQNARSKERPSERWANTRLFGEEFSRKLQSHVVSLMEDRGFQALAPELEDEIFRIFVDDKVGWTSVWSQRHMAFSAGLGTFGLSDGLITAVGKAHRVGSVVVNHPLTSPDRPDDIHRDCLFYRGIDCRTCKKRCPVDAIDDKGHDKKICSEFVFKQIPIIKERYGIDIYGCGLCQTNVPCGKGIPKSAKGF